MAIQVIGLGLVLASIIAAPLSPYLFGVKEGYPLWCGIMSVLVLGLGIVAGRLDRLVEATRAQYVQFRKNMKRMNKA